MVVNSNQAENGALVQGADKVQQAVSILVAESWMREANTSDAVPVVSKNELTSIIALIAYVANQSGQTEFGIERRLADRFNIPNVTCLPSNQFDNAIRYLVDSI